MGFVFLIYKQENVGTKLSYVVEVSTNEKDAIESLKGYRLFSDKTSTKYWCECWSTSVPPQQVSAKQYTIIFHNGEYQRLT